MRYYGHTKDLSSLSSPPTEDSKGGTTLSAYYWQQKEKGYNPVIKLKISKTCSGCCRSCHICAVEDMVRCDRDYHCQSEGSDEHMYKSERQQAWFHFCIVCDKYCSGFMSLKEHVSDEKHRKKVKLMELEKKGPIFSIEVL